MPAEPAPLRAAIDAYKARTAFHSRLLIAQAVEALEEFRTVVVGGGGLIRVHQARIARRHRLFNDREGKRR